MKKDYLKPEAEYVIFYTEEHITDEEGDLSMGGEIVEVTKPTGWN